MKELQIALAFVLEFRADSQIKIAILRKSPIFHSVGEGSSFYSHIQQKRVPNASNYSIDMPFFSVRELDLPDVGGLICKTQS